jgi:hypothetical protein
VSKDEVLKREAKLKQPRDKKRKK